MVYQILLAIEDLYQRKVEVLFLIMEWSLILYLGVFTFPLTKDLVQSNIRLKEIANRNIIYFESVSNIRRENEKEEIYHILQMEGTYLSIYSEGSKVIFIVNNSDTDPYALIGEKTGKNIGDVISLGDVETIQCTIKGNIKDPFIFIKNHCVDLQDKILIFISIDEYYSAFFYDDLIDHLHIENPSRELLQHVVDLINENEIMYTTASLNGYRNNRQVIMLNTSVIFTLLIVFSYIFLSIHHLLFLWNLMICNEESFLIHMIYGADSGNILLRILVPILLIILSPLGLFFPIWIKILGVWNFSILLIVLLIFSILIALLLNHNMNLEPANKRLSKE